MTDVKISSGPPESFGWQRKPEYDTQTGLAYERPDGKLYLFKKDGPKPQLARANLTELRAETLRR